MWRSDRGMKEGKEAVALLETQRAFQRLRSSYMTPVVPFVLIVLVLLFGGTARVRGNSGILDEDDRYAFRSRFGFIGDLLKKEFEVSSVVEIRLVGFKGDGGGAAFLDESLLQERLDALRTDYFRAHTIEPMPQQGFFNDGDDITGRGRYIDAAGFESGHDLDVRHEIMFRVLHATDSKSSMHSQKVGSLAHELSGASNHSAKLVEILQSMIREQVFEKSEEFLPVESTDKIIRDHYETTSSHGAYVLYILNPHVPAVRVGRTSSEGAESLDQSTSVKNEADDDEDDGEASAPTGWRRPVYWYTQSDESRCGMQTWVAGKHRYAWIDLAAGPSEYGPRILGDGGVTSGTIPRCTPLSAGPDSSFSSPRQKRGGFAARLAAVVWRTVQHLFLPSMARMPQILRLKSQKVGFRGSRSNDKTHVLVNIMEFVNDLTNGDKLNGDRWSRIAHSLESLQLGDKQQVRVQHERISIQECEVCLTALMQSIRSVKSFAGSQTSEYVDAMELRQKMAQLSFGLSSESTDLREDVYPVFVFNIPGILSSSLLPSQRAPILLDGVDRAVAFDDMVLSVRLNEEEVQKLDHHCNGQQRKRHAREIDLQRDVLGAILSGLWGVAPTHLRWNPLTGMTDVDWLWAVSNTPYGPYSSPSFLDKRSEDGQYLCFSFVQRDAAYRNQIYANVQSILHDTRSAFSNLSSLVSIELSNTYPRRAQILNHGKRHHVPSLSSPEFFRSALALKNLWTKLKDLLIHAATYVSILDFSHAMEYIDQSRAAADSLVIEARQLSDRIKPFITCSWGGGGGGGV